MFKKFSLSLVLMVLLALVLVACQGETVTETIEVTRVVTQTEQVEVVVTEVVEIAGEQVEVTRVVVEEVEVVIEPTEVPIPQGGNLVNSSFADANTFNPVLGNDNASSTNYLLMYSRMLELEEFTGRLKPMLIEDFDVSEDGLTYTFNMRDDVFWTDGTQLTAHDVVFTFDAINTDSVASPRRSNFATVESWQALDDFTVEVQLNALDCTGLTTWGVQSIIPAHVYEGDPENIPDHPENLSPTVTAGSFNFGEHVHDDHVTLTANPDYFRGAPNVATWTYKVYADQSAEIAGVLAGEVDYTAIGPQFASVIEGQIASGKELVLTKYFTNGYTFVGYNLANPENPQNGWDDLDEDGKWTEGEPPLEQDPHPILSELAVRQAIANSIDYTGIINKVAFGQGGPIVANVWPSIEWAYSTDIEPYVQDLELSAQILADAGWTAGSATNDAEVAILEKDGKQLSLGLMTNAGNETRENIGIIMKDVLDTLGFDITLEFIEFGTVVQNLLGQTYDMVIIGFGGGAPEPDDTSQFSYKNDEVGAGFNFVSYYNETVEANLEQGKAIAGCAESDRAPYYLSNQEEIYNDLPYSFLYVGLVNQVNKTSLLGIEPNAWNLRYNIQDWYIMP
jgi:peptide/nickel transport system substrate-binding protein